MTTEDTLAGVLARIESHATAWRPAAKQIHNKPLHERKEGDGRLILQLKSLALQAEQIAAWAREQEKTDSPAVVVTAQPVKDHGLGGLFEDPPQNVGNVIESAHGGIIIQAGRIHGGVNT